LSARSVYFSFSCVFDSASSKRIFLGEGFRGVRRKSPHRINFRRWLPELVRLILQKLNRIFTPPDLNCSPLWKAAKFCRFRRVLLPPVSAGTCPFASPSSVKTRRVRFYPHLPDLYLETRVGSSHGLQSNLSLITPENLFHPHPPGLLLATER